MKSREELNKITEKIIGKATDVYRALGPGLLESTDEACLVYELKQLGLKVESQKDLPVVYKDVKLDCGYRIDLLVEGEIAVELKAIENLLPIHTAQLLSYLKLSNRILGLLINFNVVKLIDGVHRIIND
ncbi:MAG: GxxExxY protein [Candidatus Marinimicrobia bacterium CG08_land_8_20_14_0_20_45_22]|nr:MAG: GxxExxY protein [Candidatus Marinimicrobia bacterium CG08_land_8_20_14_0_20_45_22]